MGDRRVCARPYTRAGVEAELPVGWRVRAERLLTAGRGGREVCSLPGHDGPALRAPRAAVWWQADFGDRLRYTVVVRECGVHAVHEVVAAIRSGIARLGREAAARDN